MVARADAAIRGHVHDGGLLRHAMARAQTWLAGLPADPVVVQGDPHLYNMFVDGETGGLRAIIDYGDIRIAHRADDLRYLHSNGIPFVRTALAAYVATSGIAVDEDMVGRYHALAALDHFAFVPPGAPRFPEIILWATSAVLALAPDWA
jgi:aminoglycoside phosphotransferase (APT) family kinase protein